jgi:REP element-mobilizing transposase RayT
MDWLYEARKRYGLTVLNYIVTSNHIHLLVSDDGVEDTIANSMQLIAGRTGQEYNQRKDRKGAYWEDRYHATAVEKGKHLFECMIYIDLNMVRAGAVDHPAKWIFSGYHEIQNPRERYRIIDYKKLMSLLEMKDITQLQETCRNRIEECLTSNKIAKDEQWSESIAVGSESFILNTLENLGIKVKGREVVQVDGRYQLKEPAISYKPILTPGNSGLRLKNEYLWNDIP